MLLPRETESDRAQTPAPSVSRRVYLVVCLALFLPVAFFAFCRPYWHGFDFWEQAATVRELAAHPLRPSNPILAASEPYAGRFVPYTVFWGLFERATGLGIFTTMGIAGLVNYALFAFGLYRFASRQFRSGPLPVVLLATMLLVWGRGYEHANAYHLDMFLIGLPYVAFFSFGVSLLALSYLVAFCDNGRWRNAALYAAASIVGFLSHPVTGVFCYVAALALLISRGTLRRAVLLQAVPVAAVLVALVWPWFDYSHLFLRGTGIANLRENFGAAFGRGDLPGRLGGALCGVAALAYYAVRRRHLFLGLGFVLCLGVYAIAAVARVGFLARFVFFAAFFLHVPIALVLVEGFQGGFLPAGRLAWQRAFVGLVAVALLAAALPYRWREARAHLGRLEWQGRLIPGYRSPTQKFFFLDEHLAPGDVLMAYPIDAWCVTAIAGAKTVAPIHSLSYIVPGLGPERLDREADVEAFFTGEISLEERQALLAKYGATHILVNHYFDDRWGEAFERDLDALATEVARNENLVLYQVRAGENRPGADNRPAAE